MKRVLAFRSGRLVERDQRQYRRDQENHNPDDGSYVVFRVLIGRQTVEPRYQKIGGLRLRSSAVIDVVYRSAARQKPNYVEIIDISYELRN